MSRIKSKFYIIIASVLIVIIASIYFEVSSQEIISIKVSDKQIITVGSSENVSSKYLVFTEKEVFENTDSFWFLKFSSSDFQNHLKIDSTYKVKVVGYRIPLFSSYRNIVSIEK